MFTFLKKLKEKMSEKRHNFHNKVALAVSRISLATSAAMGVVMTNPVVAFAAGDNDKYKEPVSKLTDILTTIAGAVGVVLLAYGGIKFAMAFKNHDNQGEQSAIYTIIAGGILLALDGIVKILKS